MTPMNRFKARALAAALLASFACAAPAALDVAGIDPTVDACADFYQHMNRKWIAAATIPDDRSGWGTGAIVDQRNEKVLLAALDAARKSPPPPGSAERKAVDYFASGLDLPAIETAGLTPLDPELAQAAGVKNPADLARALAFLHGHGIGGGFAFLVQPDAKNSARYLAEVAQGGLGLPERDFYFRDDERTKAQREAYVKHVAKILELAGAAPDAAARDAATVMALETDLARASMTAVERRDEEKIYNKTTVARLTAAAPGFPWAAYFDASGAKDLKDLNVAQPKFMKAFAKLAHDRPAAQWQAYLRWHVLHSAAPMLPAVFVAENYDFYSKTLRGRKAQPPRERYVLDLMDGPYGDFPMGQAVGRIFVEKAFKPEAKARALDMVENLKAALGDRLKTLDWMSATTRTRALDKLAKMKVKIGYPDVWRDYADADVGNYVFAENWLRAAQFDHRRDLARIGSPVDKHDWLMGPQMLNAYYEPRMNEIVFPAAILQPPYFDVDADDALNYGAIGMVIGHEITHGFDDSGRLYDARGNMRDWWTKEDAKRYVARAGKIEKQFDGYKGIDDIPVNGKLTLGENIADQGGLKIAYLALQKALAKNNPGKIEGLSPDQRFFLAYAQVWRIVMRDDQERLQLRTNEHSPARFRVRGPIAQMPEFSQAFSCPAGKTLLSEGERANIW